MKHFLDGGLYVLHSELDLAQDPDYALFFELVETHPEAACGQGLGTRPPTELLQTEGLLLFG